MGLAEDLDLAVRVSRRIALMGNTQDYVLGDLGGEDTLRQPLREWLRDRLAGTLGYPTVVEMSPDSGEMRCLHGPMPSGLSEGRTSRGFSETVVAHGLEQLQGVFGNPETQVAVLVMNAELYFASSPDSQVTLVRRTTESIPARRHQDGQRCPGSCLILVFTNPAAIPAHMFSSDPEMRSVQVPLPNRDERGEWLRRSVQLGLYRPGREVDQAELEDIASLTHGDSVRSLWALSVLSQEHPEEDPQTLHRLYRLGTREDHWSKLGQQLAGAEDRMTAQIAGQHHAVGQVVSVLRRAVFAGRASRRRPRGVFFLAGPTGVGKTLMAKLIAQTVFSDKERLTPFAMSEYQEAFGHAKLIGSAPGYVGYGQGGRLTEAVRQNPFQVLLFDEFEKAGIDVYDLFLEVLDEGRCTDSQGRTAWFDQSVIIFTSNIGGSSLPASVDLEDPTEDDLHACRQHYEEAVKACFRTPRHEGGIGRPELYHRIGESNVIAFNPIISPDVRRQVALASIRDILDDWNRDVSGCPLEVPEGELQDIVNIVLRIPQDRGGDRAASLEGGGRVIARRAERLVQDAIVDLRMSSRQATQGGIVIRAISGEVRAAWRDESR